ncbi:MAG: secretin N-terminal domain-containing protein [Alphaproteobacteria bacterium]|nr:secretin N-terminal domain-containing protein [Alphaproteobacteria bacterium]
MSMVQGRFIVLLACLLLGALTGCSGWSSNGKQIDPAGHLSRDDYEALRSREPAPPKDDSDEAALDQQLTRKAPPIPDLPKPALKTAAQAAFDHRISVNVTETVPLRDVLFEMARDAKVNVQIDPRVKGGVIFTAHDQPFREVLKRLCAMAGLRAIEDGDFVRIEVDEPYQQTYALDYLSLSRKTSSQTAIATNVFDTSITNATSNGGTGGGTNGSTASENNSTARVDGVSEADFWQEVDKSLKQIIASNGRRANKDASVVQSGYTIDRQSGIITVFGDSLQQAAVDTYIKQLRKKAYAQVLIDARIIEVELDNNYKSGINWRSLSNSSLNVATRFGPSAVGAPFTSASTATDGVFTGAVSTGDFAAILNLVSTFGTTRVLSSPRLTVLNNQTAVLKVATNQVYFVTQAQFTTVTNANGSSVSTTPVFTSTPHTVPVGLVMTVQPAIDADDDRVTMTLRPTISRIVGEANDPSISLNAAEANVSTSVQSQIPVLAVREMDSVIRLHSGEVAVMGGLMQDSSINQDQGVPGFDTLPIVGDLAKSRDNQATTTELVILLRATIADQPAPDDADADLYHHYNNDPRPVLPRPQKSS